MCNLVQAWLCRPVADAELAGEVPRVGPASQPIDFMEDYTDLMDARDDRQGQSVALTMLLLPPLMRLAVANRLNRAGNI